MLVKKQFLSKNLFVVFVFTLLIVSCYLLIVNNVLAVDDNINASDCRETKDNCDASSYECVTDYGFTWETDGYPGTAGNSDCCGDDSQEKYRVRKVCEQDMSCNTNSSDNACCPSHNKCAYNGYCYNSIGSPDSRIISGEKYLCTSGALWSDGRWTDCDASMEEIPLCSDCGLDYIRSGESGVGEYSSNGAWGCCGDDYGETPITSQQGSSIAWSDSSQACCYGYSCLRNGQCLDWGTSLNPGGNDNVAVCYAYPLTSASKWQDCDDNLNLCGGIVEDNMCGGSISNPGAVAGESSVGEYSNQTTKECCGDDANEYYAQLCAGVSGSRKCCNNSGDKINSAGQCVSSCNTAPSTPTNLSQSPGSEGSWTNDSTPYFDFTISDPNSGDTVGYRIEIDNSSNFGSLVGWYDWSGSTTNPNNVRYTVPDYSDLSDGSYYWRVRAEDGAGLYSSWADDSSGFQSTGIDFKIDTVNPVC